MKKYLLILTTFCTLTVTHGQTTFQKVYSESSLLQSYDMQQTLDSGFIIAGLSQFTNYTSATLLFNIDKNGNPIWNKKFGINGFNLTPYSVKQTLDSGFIVAGVVDDTISPIKHRTFLLKTDVNGNLSWGKVYQTIIDSLARGVYYSSPTVRQTSNGDFVITGSVSTTFYQGNKAFLIKTDGNGNLLWSKTYSRTSYKSLGNDIQITSDGGFILAGDDYSTLEYMNIFLLKIDSIGIPSWGRSIGIIPSDSMTPIGSYNRIETIPSGGYALSGPVADLTGWNFINIYLLKTDNNGNLQWNKILKVLQTDELSGYTVKNTIDGGFVLAGTAEDSLDHDDIYLIKTDSSGNLMWNRIYGTLIDNEMQGFCGQQTSDNGFAILGQNLDYIGSNNVGITYLIKTDSIGNSQCDQLNWTIPIVSKTFWDSLITVQVDSAIFVDTNLVFLSATAVIDTVNVCPTPVSVAEIILPSNHSQIFPNPFSTQTTFHSDHFLNNATLTIYNALGQTVKEIKNISGQTVVLSQDNLSNGLYFVRLTQENKIITTDKIVITD